MRLNISWETAILNAVGDLEAIEMNKTFVCQKTEIKDKVIAFDVKMNFTDVDHFCNKMGEMAVATNMTRLNEMHQEVKKLKGFNNGYRFFVGYTDIDQEDVWINHITGRFNWKNGC